MRPWPLIRPVCAPTMLAADNKGTLPARQHGFTLMEAMLCVLVLSVGLLGLARLQARLWSTSEHLHSTATAYLISRDHLEELSTPYTEPRTDMENESVATVTTNSTFHSTLALTEDDALLEIAIATHWQDPSGSHEILLRTLQPLTASAPDSRWLLPDHQPAFKGP